MILITAPTSTIGSQLVELLLDAQAPLRLVTRNPAKLDPRVRETTEVITGSHGDPAVIDHACEGVDAVFWLSPTDEATPTLQATFADFARPACGAFARHGVQRVVGISALGRGTPQAAHAGVVTASLEMDDLIAASGVAYRAVVNPSFMDNLLNQVGALQERDAFAMTIEPDLRAPTVATRDIAAASAGLLLDPTWTGVEELPLLGPEDLSPNDMAAILSEVLGRTIAYTQVPGQAFKDRMTSFGMGEVYAQGLVDMFDAKNDGMDNARPRTPQSTTPTTFREWCEEVLRPALAA